MKKIIGWILIFFCSQYLLGLVFGVPALLIVFSPKFSTKEIILFIILFIIALGISTVGLIYGIKKVRKEKPIDIIDYDKVLDIHLNGKIEYRDYRNLMLKLTFKKPILIVLYFIILYYIGVVIYDESLRTLGTYLFIIFFIWFFPVLTIIRAKRTYNSNITSRNLDYKLTNDSMLVKSETTESTINWTYFDKIKDTKKFFLLYKGETLTILYKRLFLGNDLKEFQEFLLSLNVRKE